MRIHDLPTPALIVQADQFERNIAAMSAIHPGPALRPHVKAHKCTAIAAVQPAAGHHGFTCATSREVLGMAAAGLGADLLLANEVLDPRRLGALAAVQDVAMVTVAVDSPETIAAAARAGLRHVLIDVDVGLPRCGCAPSLAGALADQARAAGLEVRGVMGYEGHLMMVVDRVAQRDQVRLAMDQLVAAHADVGGDIISAGGTGTHHVHDNRISEIQAGSYALMDTHYGSLGLPFEQACFVVGTVVSAGGRHSVADVGLKALGMDHGNPSMTTLDGTPSPVWFCSDEHLTFSSIPDVGVDDRILVVPAHIDPTMAMHETAWLVRDGEVIDRWPVDLRGW